MREAYRSLKGLKSVSESSMTFGRYDAMVIINAESLEEVRRIVVSEIQPISGVTETLTCLTVEDDLLSNHIRHKDMRESS
jgi:DNA-binding Lrp family transcriptional regulator